MKIKILIIGLVTILFSCEQISNVVLLEEDPINEISCFEEMVEGLDEGFSGTACKICAPETMSLSDTLFLESAFFNDDLVLTESSEYLVNWRIEGSGATIIGPTNEREVALVFDENNLSDSLQVVVRNEAPFELMNGEMDTIVCQLSLALPY